jgi:hypothetical protein
MKKKKSKKPKKRKKAAKSPARRRRAARVRPIVGPFQIELPLQMPLFPLTSSALPSLDERARPVTGADGTDAVVADGTATKPGDDG